ncbi:MAG TPA: chromate efflux transporter [Acidobacteriota bacterium]|nr:chromate efflux transporter [Acidobacteriota bacterium]
MRWTKRTAAEPEDDQTVTGASLGELALVFLKLGTVAFGGPAAHVGLMDNEVVRRRRWLSRESFLDLLGATNLIPGPNSTEMAIHIGHRQAGWPGLLVAGAAFILPASLIVTAFAWAYVRYGQLPQVQSVLYGVKPVIIAVVLQALLSLGKTAFKTKRLIVLACAAATLAFFKVNELVILGLCGLGMILLKLAGQGIGKKLWGVFVFWPFTYGSFNVAAGAVGAPFGLWPLFLFFVKVGSVLYGSGYVLLAFIRADLVDRWHWITEQQLLDAIVVGQVTPGPVFTTATFIGYLLGGYSGAVIATVGIFAPAFLFVALSGPLIPKIRHSLLAGAFLDGVNAGSLSLMAVVTYHLATTALIDVPTIVIAVAAAATLYWTRLNSAWLVLIGALVGTVVS